MEAKRYRADQEYDVVLDENGKRMLVVPAEVIGREAWIRCPFCSAARRQRNVFHVHGIQAGQVGVHCDARGSIELELPDGTVVVNDSDYVLEFEAAEVCR